MSISDSYNAWAGSYDSMKNQTRDLEAEVLRKTFLNPHYGNILEVGCGTGKNTGWLAKKADYVTALDFSSEMIEKAKQKLNSENIIFSQTDITRPWPVKPGWANIVVCSLVVEHIENIHFIFEEAAKALKRRGKFYLCELHPLKQYKGSRAAFKTKDGVLIQPEAFVHHISDYLAAAKNGGFRLLELHEHFDDRPKENIPRLVSFLFESVK
ncbi:MAG: class I SAM-dependent methyltransferase [Salinimicrobium sp.]